MVKLIIQKRKMQQKHQVQGQQKVQSFGQNSGVVP
jgi:hypothetical protein